jgi:hypothetical protein
MLRLACSGGMAAALFLLASQALAASPPVRRIDISVSESGMFDSRGARVSIVPRGAAYRYEGRVTASHTSHGEERNTFEGRMKGIAWQPDPDDPDDPDTYNPVDDLLRALRAEPVSEDQWLDRTTQEALERSCHKGTRVDDVRAALDKRYHVGLSDGGQTRYQVDVTLADGTHLKAVSSEAHAVPWTVNGVVTWNLDIPTALAGLIPSDTGFRDRLLHYFSDQILGDTAVDDPAAQERLAVLLTRCR